MSFWRFIPIQELGAYACPPCRVPTRGSISALSDFSFSARLGVLVPSFPFMLRVRHIEW
ncbi:hypothetical protein HMPREF1155_0721 [Slackia sp. CM382]|nr:hypothetical protein HMPREF1155_0721 [Slackia sp. CM382]